MKQRSNASYPELANKFLCQSIIEGAAKDYSRAGWSALRAAWACDDAGKAQAATNSRIEVIRLFQLARKKGQSFAENPAVEDAILADILRRSGKFEQVLNACQEGLAKHPADVVKAVLNFQKKPALKKNRRCYKIADAVKSSETEKK